MNQENNNSPPANHHPKNPLLPPFATYSFSVSPDLPYNNSASSTLMPQGNQPAGNLVFPPPTGWDEESNDNDNEGRNQEPDDQFIDGFMRISFDPGDGIALVELGRGQEPLMLDLDDEALNAEVDETISQHVKTRRYDAMDSAEQGEIEGAEFCVVCLSEYENKEKLATLGCGHEYHYKCIKSWLNRQNVCPMCKRTAIPKES